MADIADFTLSQEDPTFHREKSRLTCRACGAEGLVWHKPARRWRLFHESTGELHDCPNRPLPANESRLETPQRRSPAEITALAADCNTAQLLLRCRKRRLDLDVDALLDALADDTRAARTARAFETDLDTRSRVLTLRTDHPAYLPYARRLDPAALRARVAVSDATWLYLDQPRLHLRLDAARLAARLDTEHAQPPLAHVLRADVNPRTNVLTLSAVDLEFQP